MLAKSSQEKPQMSWRSKSQGHLKKEFVLKVYRSAKSAEHEELNNGQRQTFGLVSSVICTYSWTGAIHWVVKGYNIHNKGGCPESKH